MQHQNLTNVASPTNELFASVCGSQVVVWEGEVADSPRYVFPIFSAFPISAICWVSDGRVVIAATSNGTIVGWDVFTGGAAFRCQPALRDVPVIDVVEIAYSPESRRVAVADSQNLVQVWDTASGRVITHMDMYSDGLFNGTSHRGVELEWSPDGEVLYAQGIPVWHLGAAPLFSRASRMVCKDVAAPHPAPLCLHIGKTRCSSRAKRCAIFPTRSIPTGVR